jgi:hypothetical protein
MFFKLTKFDIPFFSRTEPFASAPPPRNNPKTSTPTHKTPNTRGVIRTRNFSDRQISPK